MNKPLPIGYEDFKEVVDGNFYYIDKTHMIKSLLDEASKVSLFTRPRRFGKTLNLSMIRRFFELELDSKGNPIDNGYLFEGMKIQASGERYMSRQGQYPVIDLSLKSAKQPDFEMAYESLKDEIAKEYRRHALILDGDSLAEDEKERFRAVMERRADRIEYAKALEFLSKCLARYHEKQVIILIDEYDVPLENAYFKGFYDEMIDFIRSLFESALKTNGSLEFAVITGCLRISRESIFTGLNNLEIYSILGPRHASSFGFTEEEVREMLSYYELGDKYEELKEWYDGYRFGDLEIYNPWSIINYVKTATADYDAFPKPYWSNTSSNSIIRELVEEADPATRQEIERLIAGETIEKPVHEDITYGDIHESRDNLWNFLYFTGYLKKVGERQEGDVSYLELAIPNVEIRSIYRNTILTWFDKKIEKADLTPLFTAIEDGDCEGVGNFLSDQLLDTISFYDYAENYYHGFLAGLLKTWQKYQVYSNRESGLGRSDLILKAPSVRGGAVILELKVTDKFQKMEQCCQQALAQIEEKDYEAGLREEGYSRIQKYGICFYRKECLVRKPL
ncbi:ATP-binding protein [Anaerovorax odorimutans]|uniref:ATP-binding protein n=1 Tax=Anaerovorax odorimutans TaxID=109327 RepID=A0ABT1RRU2_9FIRM|nr:AAA family ATPase [Anaerovorax odorimutans]MCQ4637876.1 ATP-binding protein [Anaerovorax odorimutans]